MALRVPPLRSWLGIIWMGSTIVLWTAVHVEGQCVGGGTVTFEKITGMTLKGAISSPLFGRSGEEPVTTDCINICRRSSDCPAFTINYDRQRCYSLTHSSVGRRDELIASPIKANYFEKICIHVPLCDKAWTFERVINRELSGYDDRIFNGIPTRSRCQELCLVERAFSCRSGEYDYALQQCRLSGEDRRTQPSFFRPTASQVDYFENLCYHSGLPECEYEEQDNVDLFQHDLMRNAFTSDQCKALCDGNRAFVCRSFTFLPNGGQCWLSGDDSANAGVRSLLPRLGASFYERTNCLDLKLSCTPETMALTLKTLEPFGGRIFAKGEPRGCEIFGKGLTTTTMNMPLQRPVCGVHSEGGGRYTNTVVIQHHPVIQRKGDRVLKLLCVFETANRTVTSDYRVIIADGTAATAIVNATAPSPNIRLRITDKNGADITGARLGDELYLRIEIDDDSVFGISAHDLIARSGKNDDFITLIDSRGCATDANIFPALQKVPGTNALQGKFDAFKFANDVVVRFEVNIQFCLQECDPIICADGSRSFGRRKRQTANTTTETPKILPDYSLQREIIVEGISVTPLKEDTDARDIEDEYSINKICTTKTVVVAAIVASVILQLCIIATCITCIVLNRRKNIRDDTATSASSVSHAYGPAGYRGSTLRSLHRLD